MCFVMAFFTLSAVVEALLVVPEDHFLKYENRIKHTMDKHCVLKHFILVLYLNMFKR